MKLKIKEMFNFWRYLGYNKEVLAKYDTQIAKDNLKIFIGILLMTALVTIVEVVSIVIFLCSGEGDFHSLLLIGVMLLVAAVLIIAMGIFYILVRKRQNKAFFSRLLSTILLALWSILFIIIGTVIDPGDYAVIACGLFLLIQVIFNSYPVENFIFVICTYTVFGVMSYLFKPTMIFMYDMIDALPFLLIGLYLSWTKSRSKWASLINADAMVQLEKQKLENELLQSRVSVMMSQIQPHFLYNALGTIKVLCTKNPQLAGEAMDHFTKYLRANMNSIDRRECISFEEELIHVENYLFIEKLRFGDDLIIKYDISTKNFHVPPLCLQTIVENAVKHGIRKKNGSGELNIRSFENEEGYHVEVEDTGVGFDTSEVKSDGRIHIGINNTRSRVKNVGGTFLVESEIGKGTKVSMLFPRKL